MRTSTAPKSFYCGKDRIFSFSVASAGTPCIGRPPEIRLLKEKHYWLGQSRLHLADQIGDRQIEHLIAPAAQDRPDHVKAEADHLRGCNRRRHRELLAIDQHFQKRGAIVLERLREHGAHLLGRFRLRPSTPAASAIFA